MNSEHSEYYSDPYDRFIEGCAKNLKIYMGKKVVILWIKKMTVQIVELTMLV